MSTQKDAHARNNGLEPNTHSPEDRRMPKQSPPTAIAVDDGLPTQRRSSAKTEDTRGILPDL